MSASSNESLLVFPCDFPIKAMGAAAQDFVDVVVGIMRNHVPAEDIGSVEVRDSRGGRYLSVTVTIRARSRPQLDAIYRELSAHARILMAL
ncbi:MAG: YbeD family protein [Gammaproteobacteria bacterium]